MNAISNPAPAANLGEQFGATTSTVLLCALQSAYSHLGDCLAEMERVTGTREPEMAALANARFRISQASYARRQLLHKACDHLLGHATGLEADVIRSLKREDAAYVRVSTEHVNSWPPVRIAHNWSAYREASRAIRASIRMGMRSEQRLLLPLLARYEHV